MAKKAWMAIGFVLYLAIAFVLPVSVQLLGIFSDQPITYPRLAIPLFLVPFLLGFAQRAFLMPWRLQLWCPAVIMLGLSVFSIIEGLSRREYLAQDLVFWPMLIGCYLGFSYVGKITRDRTVMSSERP